MAEAFQLRGSGPQAYEEHLVPAFFAPCAEQVLGLAALRPGERVLDLACGTGVVARAAAPLVGGSVVGVDLNEPMLQVAAALAPDLDWRHGDAGAIPLPDGSIDVVCCQQGLQFCADPAQVMGEIRRVLAPGGRAVLAVWRELDQHPVFERVVEVLDRRLGPAAAAILRGPFSGPGRAALHELTAGAGLEGCRVRIGLVVARFETVGEFLDIEVASTPLVGPVDTLDAGARSALVAEVEESLTPFLDDDGLVIALPTWLVSASR